MRRYWIAATVLIVAGTSLAAPKHKKKKKKPPTDDTAGSGSEIEMDAEGSATTPDPPPGKTGDAEVTAGVPGPSVPGPSVPGPTVLAAGALPLQIDARPLTLPKSRLEVHGGLPVGVLGLPVMMGTMVTTQTTTTEGLALGVTYGIDDKTEIGADYAFTLNPGDIKGPFTIHGAYLVKHDAKLDLAIAAGFTAHPVTDPRATNASATTYLGLQLGAWVRYHVAPKVSVFSGVPSLPSESASLSKLSFPLPPIGYQLSVGLTNSAAIALALPIGLGIQATPNVYVFAATNLANLKIANTSNAFLFKDFVPLGLGGFYSTDKVDVGAVFADDLKQAGSYLSFQLMLRYFVK